jgi:glutamate racemase
MKRPRIGVFDSGVGGLSVAREIHRLLPAEPIVYLADTAWCPYGGRPLEEIRERSLAIAQELVRRGAGLIVVACNTASGAALEALRSELTVPIVGMEPAVKPAARATRNRRVGVMATAATLGADRFSRLMREHAGDVEVVSHACPGLVELVESGEVQGARADAVLAPLLTPFREAGVDTLVLGCTHYPFVAAAIRRGLGPDVTLIETGEAVARQTARVLEESGWSRGEETGAGTVEVLTTGDPESVAPVVERLWGAPLPVTYADPGAPPSQRASRGSPS